MLVLSKPWLFCLLAGYVFNDTKVGHQDVAPTGKLSTTGLCPNFCFVRQGLQVWLRLLLNSLYRQSGLELEHQSDPPGLGLQAPPSTSNGVFYFIFETKSNYAALAGLELTM